MCIRHKRVTMISSFIADGIVKAICNCTYLAYLELRLVKTYNRFYVQEEGGMPAEEKNRTKPEQNKFKRVVDPLHAMIVWFCSGFLIQKIDDSFCHRRKSLSSVRIAPSRAHFLLFAFNAIRTYSGEWGNPF